MIWVNNLVSLIALNRPQMTTLKESVRNWDVIMTWPCKNLSIYQKKHNLNQAQTWMMSSDQTVVTLCQCCGDDFMAIFWLNWLNRKTLDYWSPDWLSHIHAVRYTRWGLDSLLISNRGLQLFQTSHYSWRIHTGCKYPALKWI